jgi:hypothetical protein
MTLDNHASQYHPILVDGAQIVVPDWRDLITPYVLREQEDGLRMKSSF